MGLLSRLFGTDETSTEIEGTAGEATILTLSEGGPYVNQRPTITMELEVEIPGRSPYRAEVKGVVGRLVIGQLEPGAVIPVRVDPGDPALVAIDEQAMLGRAG